MRILGNHQIQQISGADYYLNEDIMDVGEIFGTGFGLVSGFTIGLLYDGPLTGTLCGLGAGYTGSLVGRLIALPFAAYYSQRNFLI